MTLEQPNAFQYRFVYETETTADRDGRLGGVAGGVDVAEHSPRHAEHVAL